MTCPRSHKPWYNQDTNPVSLPQVGLPQMTEAQVTIGISTRLDPKLRALKDQVDMKNNLSKVLGPIHLEMLGQKVKNREC